MAKTSYLRAVSVHPGGFPVVNPGVLEHKEDIIDKLPRVCVGTRVELSLNAGHVHRLTDDLEVVGDAQRIGINWDSVKKVGLKNVQRMIVKCKYPT